MSAMTFREPNQVRWVGVRPAHLGTQVVKWVEIAGDGSVVHTVTAGKTFFLTTMIVNVSSASVARWGYIRVRDEADGEVYRLSYLKITAIGQYNFSVTFNPPLEIPQLYDIYIYTNHVDFSLICTVHGWEE